jgi:hypothetical protein
VQGEYLRFHLALLTSSFPLVNEQLKYYFFWHPVK